MFPKDFLWGASTASHQIEGGNRNNWSDWELQNADLQVAKAKKKYEKLGSWLDVGLRKEMQSKENYLSGGGAQSNEHFHKDIDLLEKLHLNSYRFSLEWSRLEPSRGQWDEGAFQYYRQLLIELQSRDITPIITLWHWTVPVWFEKRGGWLHREAPQDFKKYTEKVIKELGDLVTYWITLNEPGVFAQKSYVTAYWPPMKRNPLMFIRVMQRLFHVSELAASVIKANNPGAYVGFAQHQIVFKPASNAYVSRLLSFLFDYIVNVWPIKKLVGHLDFIGLNFYEEKCIRFGAFVGDTRARKSDLGWELHPEGLGKAAAALSRHKKPIIVTEHGLADEYDLHREWYIKESLHSLHKAMQEGADVRGYLHWSLIDNFEWAEGYWPKFGLAAIDATTKERIPRKSALWYAKVAKTNGEILLK